jgi:tight adherence protein C
MMNTHFFMLIGLMLFTFAAVVALVLGVFSLLFKRHVGNRLSQLLGETTSVSSPDDQVLGRRWNAVLESLSKLSLPKEGWQGSNVHLKFLRAGIRGVYAPRIYYAVKSILTLVMPVIVGLITLPYAHMALSKFVLIILLLATLGYYLPEIYLNVRTKRRMKDSQQGLPDLIDLLVICTESGLGLDAAFNRVSKEIARSHPYLAEELYLTNLEIRAGAGRNIALKNLALRTDLESVHNLVSMLTQSDRFGTSIADSLRAEASLMRIRRMQAAEEIAAKIPVKVLMPMVLCIFPSLFIVIIGPAIIQMRVLFQ